MARGILPDRVHAALSTLVARRSSMTFLRILLCVALIMARVSNAQSTDARVESLLRRMTLAEKIGEMTQIDISAVTRVTGTATRPQQLDSAKLEEIVANR